MSYKNCPPGIQPLLFVLCILAAMFAISGGTALADNVVSMQWSQALGTSGDDAFYSIAPCPDGGFIAVGEIATGSAGARSADGWVLKLNSTGYVIWDVFSGVTGWDAYSSVVVEPNGNLVVAGWTLSADSVTGDGTVVKFDSEGNQLWRNVYGGTGSDAIWSIVLCGDGGYILAGQTTVSGAINVDGWVIKTDSDGEVEWSQTFGGTNSDIFGWVVANPDGSYIVTGQTGSFGPGGVSGWLVKLDSEGNELWSRIFGGTLEDEFYSVAMSPDGGYVVAGKTTSSGAGSSDGWVVKTDSEGNGEWSQVLGGTEWDTLSAVILDPDGGYIFTGQTVSSGMDSYDGWMLKLGQSGDTQWSQLFTGIMRDEFWAIAAVDDDGFIMAGKTESLGAGGSDGWIVRVSSPELLTPTTDGTANTPGLGGPVLLPFMLAFLVLILLKKRYR